MFLCPPSPNSSIQAGIIALRPKLKQSKSSRHNELLSRALPWYPKVSKELKADSFDTKRADQRLGISRANPDLQTPAENTFKQNQDVDAKASPLGMRQEPVSSGLTPELGTKLKTKER